MPTQLTDKQRDFINVYLVNKTVAQQKKIVDAFIDYDRRLQKVLLLISKMDPNSPEKGEVENLVTDAKNRLIPKVRADFKTAWELLATAKRRAKRKAKSYAAGLRPGDVANDLARLGRSVDAIIAASDIVQEGMDALLEQVTDHPKAGDQEDMEAALVFRDELVQQLGFWEGEIERLRALANRAAVLADQADLARALNTTAHQIRTLQQEGDTRQKQAAEAFTQPMLALNARATPRGKLYSSENILNAFEEQVVAVKAAIQAVKSLGAFQQREQEGPIYAFGHLDERDEARLALAKEKYVRAIGDDAALSPDAPPRDGQNPAGRTPLRIFNADDVLDDEIDDLDDDEIDNGRIVQATERAVAALRDIIANEPPNSDVVFDLMLKSQDDLKADLARAMGLEDAPQAWPPARAQLIEQMAAELYQTILEASPNRASEDKTTVTLNGVTYGAPERIGAGGLGDIFRYVSEDGAKVIVKTLRQAGDAPEQLARNRKDMTNEMRMHRQVSGGETGACHPNILPMRGAAVAPDGTLMMLMDEAEGGDLQTLSNSVNELQQAGLIPVGARTAMVQRTMKQAVIGLKAMHDQGAMHLDVKPQNFFLDGDGNVRIADFGSTRLAGDDGTVDTAEAPTTGAFAPAEYGGRMALKEEVFWLGSLMESLSSADQDQGATIRSGGFTGDMAGVRTKEGDDQFVKATSLDRLRNAMLDPDPERRPSLDGVLLSSYLADEEQSYTDEDMAELMQAVTDLNKTAGRAIGAVAGDLNLLRGNIIRAQNKAYRTEREKQAAEQQIAEWRNQLPGLEQQIRAILEDPNVAPLVAAVQKAGAAFAV